VTGVPAGKVGTVVSTGTAGGATMGSVTDRVSTMPSELVALQVRTTDPDAAGVKVTTFVAAPAMMVAPVAVHAYVADPAGAFAVVPALFIVAAGCVVMAQLGIGTMVVVAVLKARVPAPLKTLAEMLTVPEAAGVKEMLFVPAPLSMVAPAALQPYNAPVCTGTLATWPETPPVTLD
jgi:hypothetical protein